MPIAVADTVFWSDAPTCAACGARLAPDGRFCPACGAQVENPPSSPRDDPASATAAAEPVPSTTGDAEKSAPPVTDAQVKPAETSSGGRVMGGPIRASGLFRLATVSLGLLVLGALGPWQDAIFVSASGLQVSPVLILPAIALAAWAVYEYDRGRQAHYKRIAWLFIVSGALVALMELGNAAKLGGGVMIGWGAVVSAPAAVGLAVAGVKLLRRRRLASAGDS